MQNTDTDTLIDLDGALQLGVTAEGKVQLSVTTTEGTQTLTSSSEYSEDNDAEAADNENTANPVNPASVGEGTLSPGRWHTVAARLFNGTLTLSVDGIIDQISVEGTLAYGDSGRYTLSAPTQVIHYNSFRLYDWNTETLLSLLDETSGLLPLADIDDTDTQQVQLDSTGRATLYIASRGQLNNQQTGSALSMLRVAASSDNGRDTVSVISSEYYQSMLGYYVEHVAKDAPPLLPSQQGALPGTMMIGALNYMVPPANAFFGDLAWGALNFLIPIEDVGVLIKQLYYLATNDPDFSMSELVGSALGTLTIIPVAKVIKPFIPGLKATMRLTSRINPVFFKSAAGPLGKAVKRAFANNTDTILQWLPTLYVMAQMALDEDTRESLLFILNTIQSEDDLSVWIDYLSMPADGWEGEGLKIASVTDDDDVVFYQNSEGAGSQNALLGFLVKEARAQGINRGRRVAVKAQRLSRTIVDIRSKFASNGAIDPADIKKLIGSVRGVTNALKRLDAEDLRPLAFSSQLLQTSGALAENGLQNLFHGAQALRIPAPVFIAILAYLDSRQECKPNDPFSELVDCKDFPRPVTETMDTVIGNFLTNLVTRRNRGRATNYANGLAFHLTMLAYYQLLYETDTSDLRPVNQEATETLNIPLASGNNTESVIRRTDIVLNKESGEDADREWVEVKSLIANSARASKWTVGGKNSPHREFSVDCFALNYATINPTTDSDFKGIKKFHWWLQSFENDNSRSPDAKKVKTFAGQLQQMPGRVDPAAFGAVLNTDPICKGVDPALFNFQTVFINILLTNMNVVVDLL